MQTAIFCCGKASNGELGLRVVEDHVTSLTPLRNFLHGDKVRDIACSLNHTIVLLQDGTVYTCGNNDCGQLGRGNSQRRLELVDCLSAHTIQNIDCGIGFSVALSEPGQLFACGNNSHGQLGIICDEETVPSPKLIKSLALMQIIQVACGDHHSLALTNDGEVYSWGKNNHYQLGSGTDKADKAETRPQLVKSLEGLPIAQIAAGGNHSLALTLSGALFCWGKNEFGQLGLSDTTDKMYPVLQKTLRSQYVTYVSCGENHSAILTKDGGVFTFGAGMYGQLGHGSKNNELLPRKVSELMGNVVTQIACGRCHTVAYVPSKRRIYSFGLGSGGQLGLSKVSQINTSPTVMPGPWIGSVPSPTANSEKDYNDSQDSALCDLMDVTVASPCVAGHPNGDEEAFFNRSDVPMDVDIVNGEEAVKEANDDEEDKGNLLSNGFGLAVRKIVCGGDHTFVIGYQLDPCFENVDQALDFRIRPPESTILTIDIKIMESAMKTPSSVGISQDIMSHIETVFSSAACLNGSFLKSDGSHFSCNFGNHGIDLSAVYHVFHCIEAAQNSSVSELVVSCLGNNLLPNLSPVLDVEALRLYVYLPLSPPFQYPESHLTDIIYPFSKAYLQLGPEPAGHVASWWAKLEVWQFKDLVLVFKKSLLFTIQSMADKNPDSLTLNRHLYDFLNILKILKNVNIICKHLLPYQDFYMPEITDLVDVKRDYVLWLQTPPCRGGQDMRLFLCDFPFLFDARAKTLILQADSLLQMRTAMDSAFRQNLTSFFMPSPQLEQPYLVLRVSRENMVLDTIEQLGQQEYHSLKKPLQVVFRGEVAVDAGGVKKEFFLLLTKEMLDPKYGMFKEYPETRCIWFHPQTFEDAGMFGLIGIVCGLAIYNSIIIDLPFPLVLYKKLLKEEIKLEDVGDLSPTVVKGLRDLLEYEADDVEEVFFLFFEVTMEIFGDPVSYELKPGGKEIPVTKENRFEYVDLYVDFFLNKSIQVPFEAFSRGFYKVCSSRILELFHAQELMALVIGNESYDWEKLEKCAEYKNGYYKDHPAIQMFWKVFHSLSEDDKRKFLLFLTGSDRIPILGMESIKIVVQPMNVSDDYLPVAHTCFNILDLPHYSSEGVLRVKLLQAIQHTHGFGLV